ncbi:unnamed protein product [Closterium sp. NIES-65]|nr:unnamed protein product [Closterium sp. NIES-65]
MRIPATLPPRHAAPLPLRLHVAPQHPPFSRPSPQPASAPRPPPSSAPHPPPSAAPLQQPSSALLPEPVVVPLPQPVSAPLPPPSAAAAASALFRASPSLCASASSICSAAALSFCLAAASDFLVRLCLNHLRRRRTLLLLPRRLPLIPYSFCASASTIFGTAHILLLLRRLPQIPSAPLPQPSSAPHHPPSAAPLPSDSFCASASTIFGAAPSSFCCPAASDSFCASASTIFGAAPSSFCLRRCLQFLLRLCLNHPGRRTLILLLRLLPLIPYVRLPHHSAVPLPHPSARRLPLIPSAPLPPPPAARLPPTSALLLQPLLYARLPPHSLTAFAPTFCCAAALCFLWRPVLCRKCRLCIDEPMGRILCILVRLYLRHLMSLCTRVALRLLFRLSEFSWHVDVPSPGLFSRLPLYAGQANFHVSPILLDMMPHIVGELLSCLSHVCPCSGSCPMLPCFTYVSSSRERDGRIGVASRRRCLSSARLLLASASATRLSSAAFLHCSSACST